MLVPVRLEVETENRVLRDCLLWNKAGILLRLLHETDMYGTDNAVTPEQFAKSFVNDVDFPETFAGPVARQIREAIEKFHARPPPEVAKEVYRIMVVSQCCSPLILSRSTFASTT